MENQTYRDSQLKKDLTVRLNRIEGQIRGINKMVENNCYCDDILIQLSSVQSALKSAGRILLENHIKTCVVSKIKNDEPDILDEFIKTISRVL